MENQMTFSPQVERFFSAPKAILVLEDGKTFWGRSFGSPGESVGEVVFNTSMTGYQEILTDPSYKGQIVVMTYPQMGNYGVHHKDYESNRPFVEGFCVREYSPSPTSDSSLQAFLQKHGVVGIEGIDTRALVRHIRRYGSLKGVLSTTDFETQSLQMKAKEFPGLNGRDLVKEVTSERAYPWPSGGQTSRRGGTPTIKLKKHVVVYDFGVKTHILRNLSKFSNLTIVPAMTSAEEVLALKPDGIVLSNGPGDPNGVEYAIQNVRKLVGKKPIFGICLGHQLIALALGGKTYKLKFGHHGGNHPVKNLLTGEIQITTQNHCYAVDEDSLGKEILVTHRNLNDRTVEGMEHRTLPLFSVQYHPEASPGPHDAQVLFERFREMMEESQQAVGSCSWQE